MLKNIPFKIRNSIIISKHFLGSSSQYNVTRQRNYRQQDWSGRHKAICTYGITHIENSEEYTHSFLEIMSLEVWQYRELKCKCQLPSIHQQQAMIQRADTMWRAKNKSNKRCI